MMAEQGSFGEVYLAKWRGCHVAVKRIKLPMVRVARRRDRRAWLKQLGLADEARDSVSGSHSSFSDDDHDDDVDQQALLEEQHRKLAEAFVRELTLLRRVRRLPPPMSQKIIHCV
jgi:serine/threonine protein kinase